jgi:hypothetical protein
MYKRKKERKREKEPQAGEPYSLPEPIQKQTLFPQTGLKGKRRHVQCVNAADLSDPTGLDYNAICSLAPILPGTMTIP